MRFCYCMALWAFWTILVNGNTDKNNYPKNQYKSLITLSLLLAPTDAALNPLKLTRIKNDITTELNSQNNMNNRDINSRIDLKISHDKKKISEFINKSDNHEKLWKINYSKISNKFDSNNAKIKKVTMNKVSSKDSPKKNNYNSRKNVKKVRNYKNNVNNKILRPKLKKNNFNKINSFSSANTSNLSINIKTNKINSPINQMNNKKNPILIRNSKENNFVKRELNNSSTLNESMIVIDKIQSNSLNTSILPIKLNPQNFVLQFNKQIELIDENSDKIVSSSSTPRSINQVNSQSLNVSNETYVINTLPTVSVINDIETTNFIEKSWINETYLYGIFPELLEIPEKIENTSSFVENISDNTSTPSKNLLHLSTVTNRHLSSDILFYEDEVTEFYGELNTTFGEKISDETFFATTDVFDNSIDSKKVENSNFLHSISDFGGFNNTDSENSTRLMLNQWPVKHSAVVEGDLVLGGLMMVHEREDTVTCGPVMPQGGVQALEAMLYTLDWLNKREIVPGVKIGAHILDDCDKDTYGLEMAVDFIKETAHGNPRNGAASNILRYTASIWYDGIQHCGGAIITNRQIITAAHCIHGGTVANFRVVVGFDRLLTASEIEWHHVMAVDVIVDYEVRVISEVLGLQHTDDDIGVITLETPLIFSDSVAPIAPLCTIPPHPGSSCYAIQYRCQETKSIHTLDLALYWTSVDVIDNDRCKQYFPHLNERQGCIVSDGEIHDTRPGDSGSPIICDGKLFAVNHGGCNDSTAPAIITPIFYYIDFVKDVIETRRQNDVITIHIA